MKKLLVLLTGLMLVSSLGMAQADPDENSMGVYFDTDATIYMTTTAAPFQSVTAYLVVANPTSNGVSGWECKVTVVGPAVAAAWTTAAGTDYNADPELFTVGIGTGVNQILPVNNVVVLASWTGFIMAPVTDQVFFTVYPFPGSVTFDNVPGYVDGDDAGIIVNCGTSTGYPYGAACAAINAGGIIANEDVTWSTVKSLYQ